MKELLLSFWNQKNRDYRDFHLIYGFLALHFVVSGVGGLVSPAPAEEFLAAVNSSMGGIEFPFSQNAALWRVPAGAGVLTLAVLCVFVQLDVRRNWPALYFLLFLKGLTGLCFLAAWLAASGMPAYFAYGAWDLLMCGLFVFFGLRGRAAAEADESVLVPAPLGRSG